MVDPNRDMVVAEVDVVEGEVDAGEVVEDEVVMAGADMAEGVMAAEGEEEDMAAMAEVGVEAGDQIRRSSLLPLNSSFLFHPSICARFASLRL